MVDKTVPKTKIDDLILVLNWLITDIVIAGVMLLLYWGIVSLIFAFKTNEVTSWYFIFHSWWSLIPLGITILMIVASNFLIWVMPTDEELAREQVYY